MTRYEDAGVSLATADAVVDRLRAAVESTGAAAFGRFAGLFPVDEQRLLAASTDSVGSKLILHRRAGTLRWGGMDLAAHCINDVLCSGAEPLFLLDYVAANRIDLDQVAELVEGAVELLVAKLDGHGTDEVVLLAPELTVRASTGPAPSAP